MIDRVIKMFKQVIYYFIAVVEQGSFSKAAKKFYLSQSAISQQITKLENDLGFSLFDRRTYYPTLTEEGKRYYDLAKKLLSDYKNEYNDIKENLQKEVLTIGSTGPFERKHVPFIVKQFKENDAISIDIKAFNLFTCIEKLNNREIDIAFGLSNNFKYYPDLIYRTIYHSHVCVVTSLEHPLSHKEYVTIKDIKNEPLIVLSKKQGKEYYHDYMEAFRLDGMIPYIKKEVDDLNEYVMAISLGEGIGLSATEVISENDQVAVIPLKESHHHADYAVGYHQDNGKKAIQQFMKYVEDYFRL